MSAEQMIKSLIEACEKYQAAKTSYDVHSGGGATQKIKNQRARDMKIAYMQMTNVVFNIKQLLK